jgi:hypothetical protein
MENFILLSRELGLSKYWKSRKIIAYTVWFYVVWEIIYMLFIKFFEFPQPLVWFIASTLLFLGLRHRILDSSLSDKTKFRMLVDMSNKIQKEKRKIVNELKEQRVFVKLLKQEKDIDSFSRELYNFSKDLYNRHLIQLNESKKALKEFNDNTYAPFIRLLEQIGSSEQAEEFKKAQAEFDFD